MMQGEVNGKRIYVGLSGGVDSAVTAALLQKAGAQVTGVFIKGWYPPGMPCTWRDDRRDAMRVAARLSLPFKTLDAGAEYKQGVIDYLIGEYRAGRTPNPDIMCNREVKFGAFYRLAREAGADLIATGHYARMEEGRLLRGIDEGKDQSYFLWAVPKEVLRATIFPLGGLRKEEVRKQAEGLGLPNAGKKDSQGICFLGSISVEDFLKDELGPEEGKAVDAQGNKVGVHGGAVLYTLGERIALEKALPGPWYVVKKDLRANTITVSRERETIGPKAVALTDTNWLADTGGNIEAQYRYHGSRVGGTYDKESSTFTPSGALPEPIASGQSLVLYRGDECLGGGIIE